MGSSYRSSFSFDDFFHVVFILEDANRNIFRLLALVYSNPLLEVSS